MNKLELDIPERATAGVIAVGNFDGVHLGHQQMLKQIASVAKKLSAPAVILTFDPHPIKVLRPAVRLPRLTTIAERVRLLKQHGATEVVILPANEGLLSMSPAEFFEEVVIGQLQARAMVEGPDFRFGRDRAGDIPLLEDYCRSHSIELHVIKPVQSENELVSSTRLRSAISRGQVQLAETLLNRPYSLSGTVASGAARGRELGFPTANLVDIPVLIPADGVYAGFSILNEQRYPVAISIGPNPTFQEAQRKVECHLLNYSNDLYDQELTISFLTQLRGMQQFESSEQLVQQITSDVEQTNKIFNDTFGI